MKLKKVLRDFGDSFFGSDRCSFNDASLTGNSHPIEWGFTLSDEGFYFPTKDSHGVPTSIDSKGNVVYFPTRVATYAFAHFNRYTKHGDAASRELFLRMAAWFMAAEDGVWLYHCDYRFAGATLKSPWISAMAQGEGISVLTRAYELTGDGRYLARARQAVAPLLVPIADGGVRSRIGGRWDFLEEYPLPEPRHTLNGFLSALIGLLDLAAIAPEEAARVDLDGLIAGLKHNIALWDMGYWSAYDAHRTPTGLPNPATVAYHRVHIAQLRYLGGRLDEPALTAVAGRWFDAQRSARNRLRALRAKLAYRSAEPPSSFSVGSTAARPAAATPVSSGEAR